MANSKFVYSILWLVVLWFISWPIAGFAAGFWLLIQVCLTCKISILSAEGSCHFLSLTILLTALWSMLSIPQVDTGLSWKTYHMAPSTWTGYRKWPNNVSSSLLRLWRRRIVRGEGSCGGKVNDEFEMFHLFVCVLKWSREYTLDDTALFE